MTDQTRHQPLTLAAAQAEAVASALRKVGGYCAMPHPTGLPGSCSRWAGHVGFHRDWYRRKTPLGPYLEWTDAEYA
ncbi:hypothetical protein [Streptomyces sp. NRRL S-813]|uniref:hypothetical protein n=1 Tax=Streptomyces sp. NRRL S-813 TaxID=1463919 RepID=UPI0004BF8E39|nr:hypothetical protein [Streptomyces sp. NRRL S-813]